MAVYVDNIQEYPRWFVKPIARKYGLKWCHMYADSIEELHEMAKLIGMSASWFQNRPNFAHYDLTPTMREKALALGAIDDSDKKVLKSWIAARMKKED